MAAVLGKAAPVDQPFEAEDDERRRAPRADIRLPLHLTLPSVDSFFDGEAVNISSGGMFITTDKPPAVGTQLDIDVALDNGQLVLHATAEVMRHQTREPPYGMGIRFVDISYEAQSLIDRMVTDDKLFGHYKIEKLIGQGAMAEVYLARTLGGEDVGRPVALKRVRPELAKDKTIVNLFMQEAELTRGLCHPNIVDVLDVGKVGDTYYIAMDYVRGCNLMQVLRACRERDIALPVDFCAYVCHQVAIALEYAHTLTGDGGEPLGLVHRDVAPSNVFISEHGDIKLGDFGVAHISTAGRASKTIVAGKDPYIAPEQLKGRGVTPASDVFSLGAILYEMLTNRIAFVANSRTLTYEKIMRCHIPTPIELRGEVGAALTAVVMTAVSPRVQAAESLFEKAVDKLTGAKHPWRYESAAAFAEAISPLYDPAIGTQLGIAAVVRHLGLEA